MDSRTRSSGSGFNAFARNGNFGRIRFDRDPNPDVTGTWTLRRSISASAAAAVEGGSDTDGTVTAVVVEVEMLVAEAEGVEVAREWEKKEEDKSVGAIDCPIDGAIEAGIGRPNMHCTARGVGAVNT